MKNREELMKYYGKEDISEVEFNEARRIFK